MAKTIEELKQMIDSVIVENGKGQITGQGLNLVLNEMSDALSEMGGGGGAYQIYIPSTGELTEEQIAFNAQQFAVLEPKLQNKEFVQVGASAGAEMLGMGFMCAVIPQVIYGDLMGTGSNSIVLIMDSSSMSSAFILNSDGTISSMS